LEEEAVGGLNFTDEASGAVSDCLPMIETALMNNGELIVIPGTREYGRRRTGKEDARVSEKFH